MTTFLSRAWSLVSPAKPTAPQSAETATTTPPTTKAPSPATEQDADQDFFGQRLRKTTPRSLFSDKDSEYMPGSKRKFELDFESPKIAKKAKVEQFASSKRKRDLEFETPQKRTKPTDMSQTMPPIRSAMKPLVAPRTPGTGKKNVSFGRQPLTDTKIVRPFFGKAGNYKGSVFADTSPLPFSSPEPSASTPSIISISDTGSSQLEMSPSTRSNTESNTPSARNGFYKDPYNPNWQPQPHNPRPGEFCLPDDLSQYDDDEDESNIFDQSTPVQPNISTTSVSKPPNSSDIIRESLSTVLSDSPEAPRPSHAQLPSTTSQGPHANTSTSTHATPPQVSHSSTPITKTIPADADTSAVLKARAAAEKYKPASVGKQASKLSQVTSARSRSSSPPGSRTATPAFGIGPALPGDADVEPLAAELSLQFDKWARDLKWPAPGEKIVEEEVFNSEMMEKIREEWTSEDDEQSLNFWEREFERVVESGKRAEAGGKALMFV